MTKIQLTKTDWQLTATYLYNPSGTCTQCSLPEDVDPEKARGFFTVAKMTFREMLHKLESEKTVKIQEIPKDISFEGFWNAYTYKVGSKVNAEKHWNKLSEIDKIQAITKIKEYDRYIGRTGVAKIYPERYISQRRWENEFK
jgi:hypothetical protein